MNVGNAAVSLFAGAFGGVLFAGTAARRAEAAKARFAARNVLRGVITQYRDALAYGGESAAATATLGKAWENVAQEDFVATILLQLDHLGRRKRNKLQSHLELLVGRATVTFVAGRVNVPSHLVDTAIDAGRLGHALREAAESGAIDAISGQITPMRSEGDSDKRVARFQQVLATIDAMLAELKPLVILGFQWD